MKLIFKLVMVAVVVVVLAEGSAHYFLQSEIVAAVAKRDPSAEDVSAGVEFPMLWQLAAHGSVPRVTVSARHVNLSTLTADKVTAVARGVHMNMVGSLADRQADVTRIDRIDLTVTFTDKEASALLPPGNSFVFGAGTVTIKGLATSITGRFQLEPPARIVFAVEGLKIPGFPSLPAISIPVRPLASCVQGIRLTPGYLMITCVETNPTTTDFLPHR